MTALRLHRRREALTAAERRVKDFDADIFKEQPAAIYGGYLSDGVLLPDLAPRYEQWFDGYTPASIIGAHYCASLGRYYAVQGGGVMEKGADDDAFTFVCYPLDPDFFFYDEYDGANYRVIYRNQSKGYILTPYLAEAFTPQKSLSMAIRHHHRLFGVDADDALVLRWSGAENSEDWSEDVNGSGYVRLGGALGKILQLMSFGTKVVVLRERGLTCLTALGAPENFKINDYPLPSSPIEKGLAAVCGDRLYFYARTGIMYFDGDGVEAAEAPFQSGISAPVCAAAMGEKYLLGCGENVYCLDTQRDVGYFIDCPADIFLNGVALLAFGSGEAHIIDRQEPSARWISRGINFGRKGEKTVTGLYIACGGDCSAAVASENGSKSFTGGGYFRVGLRGKNFTVTITADAPVTAAKLYAEAYDGI